MELKIAVFASGQLIAQEVVNIIQSIIDENLMIQTYFTPEMVNRPEADIYICTPTQVHLLQKLIPKEEIFTIDLMPNSRFFIDVARIPKNEDVYIFNNYLKYINALIKYCKKIGIDGVNFIPIAYWELSEEEVASRIQCAKYIIGVDRFVGEGGLLSPTYRSYLRKDVTIIPAVRAISVPSALNLIKCIAEIFHYQIAESIDAIKIKLANNSSPETIVKLRDEVTQLALASSKIKDSIQSAVIKSVLKNISAQAMILDSSPDVVSLETLSMNELLTMVTDANFMLKLIAKKLTHLS